MSADMTREELGRLAITAYVDPHSADSIVKESEKIVLPEYELKACPYECPWCGGKLIPVTVSDSYIGPEGVYRLDNLPIYRCASCSWETVPHDAFELVTSVIRNYIKE